MTLHAELHQAHRERQAKFWPQAQRNIVDLRLIKAKAKIIYLDPIGPELPPEPEAIPRFLDICDEYKTGLGKRVLNVGQYVCRMVAERHGVTSADIRGVRRHKRLVKARQELCYVLRIEYGWSNPRIAKFLDRDHTTVLHSVRQHQARLNGERA